MGHPLRLTLASLTETYSFQLNDRSVKIGRSLKCGFNVPRDDLSREHGLFEIENEDYFITDLGSKNGIYVDRQRIEANTRTKVTQESLVVFSNLYTLRINALDIQTKPDMHLRSRDLHGETSSFQFSEVKLVRPIASDEAKSYESFKMIIGFIAILGFIIYQALGR